MTTIEEDLESHIDDNWNVTDPADFTMTSYVFMKEDPADRSLEPPIVPATGVILIIMGSLGYPSRISQGADLWTYEGEIFVYSTNYADVDIALTELKEIADGTTGSDLTFSKSGVRGDPNEKHFYAISTWKWIKRESRA